MRKRNRGNHSFIDAAALIRIKELDVYHATVDPQFTLDDVARWLFPEEVIQKLKATFPVSAAYSGRFSTDITTVTGDTVKLILNFNSIAMQCPQSSIPLYTQACSAAPAILGVIQEIANINKQFDKVRAVIDWFNEHHVTPSAARYYWPAILSLLPASHAVHEKSGNRYREVTGIGEIIPLLRETAAIVASAHLCPHIETKAQNHMVVYSTQHFSVL